jgi:hypothetical protein
MIVNGNRVRTSSRCPDGVRCFPRKGLASSSRAFTDDFADDIIGGGLAVACDECFDFEQVSRSAARPPKRALSSAFRHAAPAVSLSQPAPARSLRFGRPKYPRRPLRSPFPSTPDIGDVRQWRSRQWRRVSRLAYAKPSAGASLVPAAAAACRSLQPPVRSLVFYAFRLVFQAHLVVPDLLLTPHSSPVLTLAESGG